MNTKITPIDKKNGIRGEWSVYNSEKKTHDWTLQFNLCASRISKENRFKHRAHSPTTTNFWNHGNSFLSFYFFFFLQLFYIVGCFFLHLLLLCVSKVIKMCWKKSQWRICRYIFFFRVAHSMSETIFYFRSGNNTLPKGRRML